MDQINELITGFRRGALKAVRELHAIYYSSLLNFSERIIRDRRVAREIVLDTFIKLLNRRIYFENLADIKAFLFITARNSSMDFLHFTKNGNAVEVPVTPIVESRADLSDVANASKAEQILQAGLESLPAINRQVFRILFVEGMPTAAAARQLDIDAREMLNYRRHTVQHLQTVLSENNLFSTPFFIHYLTVACRQNAALRVPVNR